MTEKPVGERIATIEAENRIGAQDRRDLWDAVNDVRMLPAQLEAWGEKIDRIEEFCKDKSRRIDATELRLAELEKRAVVNAAERNIILGIVAFVGSIVGSIATWAVTHFLAGIKT